MARSTSRRALTLAVVCATGTAATAPKRPARAQNKAPKSAVQYQDEPRGDDRCAGCRHFEAATETCKLVEGAISPNDWCTLFAPPG
ncbi:MAG: hypothetical protein RID91_07620 [Azospirillaceae bacterium]